MPVSPQYVGAIYKPLLIKWNYDGGKGPVNLTGATITCRFRSATDDGISRAGTGTITQTWIDPDGTHTVLLSQGQFYYQFSLADLATPDTWKMQFKADFGGGKILYHNPFQQEVQAPI